MTDPVVADVLSLALVHVLGAGRAGVTGKAGAPGQARSKLAVEGLKWSYPPTTTSTFYNPRIKINDSLESSAGLI